jgi:hypothetical protein
MAVLGRILQAIGWLWVLAGFFGNFINLPVGNIVPGIILLFIARVVRAQAGRRERAEGPEDVLATQSVPTDTQTAPRRVPSMRPPPEPRVEPAPTPSRHASAEPERSRSEALEKILLAGNALEEDLGSTEVEIPVELAEGEVRLSSAEMIARARQRWDRRP